MSEEEWANWAKKIKTIATEVLGYKIIDIELEE